MVFTYTGLVTLAVAALSSGASALVAKDGHTGRLPAMGFNSWNGRLYMSMKVPQLVLTANGLQHFIVTSMRRFS